MDITLSPGDPRLGNFDEKGLIDYWPELDVFERPYTKVNATVRRVPKSFHFVVVPPARDHQITSVTLVEPPKTETGADLPAPESVDDEPDEQ